MARDLTATIQTETQASLIYPEVFAEFDFGSGFLRVWTGLGSKSWDSNTWTGVGDLGSIPNVEEATDISPRNVTFALSGIPSSTISVALTENYRGRSVRSWIAFLDSSGTIKADPYQWFAGRMDTMSIRESADSADISISCENCLVDLRRPRSTRYTPAEQERRFPGDTSLRYVAKLAEKPIYWGIPTASSVASVPPITTPVRNWVR
jgi:hypothetical protein